jgi:Winged helix DNA-binding domain
VLSHRTLNRTLLARQHLLERVSMPALQMGEHLLGLQAQEPLPPYLSLWSRLRDFDPTSLSAALEERRCVRLLLMRGTIHLVTPRDALLLRPVVQPMLDKVTRTNVDSGPAANVDRPALAEATRTALAGGPVGVRRLGELLGETFPDVPAAALANTARALMPLVQVPPRGRWKQPGGVVYQTLASWLGPGPDSGPEPRPGPGPDLAEVVRRYLRAFGPATAADVTAWSGATGMRAVFAAMKDELRTYRDDDGRELFDLEGLPVAGEGTPAPVRLLGRYDNLWLSHARRDRVTPDPEKRRRWMGVNGGAGNTLFVDGELEGLWRQTDGGALDIEPFRQLTRAEQAGLDEEVAALETFLAR